VCAIRVRLASEPRKEKRTVAGQSGRKTPNPKESNHKKPGKTKFEKSFQYFWSFGALTFGIFHRHAVISGPVF
jgi:hypothetical protein